MPVFFKTFGAIGVFLTVAASAADAADQIGSATRIVNKVTAEAAQAARNLSQGDGVAQNEVIAVDAESLGELRLNDDTKLALGPGSKMKLDKFVYDADKGTGAITVDLAKGAFRFITGIAKKNSYSIRSPNATITVRGTVFDVYVDANGDMWVLLHEGSIEICNNANQCKVIKDPCGMVRAGGTGTLTDAATWNRQSALREVDFATAFPFVITPPLMDPAPRFTRVNVEEGNCPSDTVRPPAEQRAEVPDAETYSPPRQQSYAAPPVQGPVRSPPSQPPLEPMPAVEPEAAPVLARSFSGFYAGVSAGTVWQRDNPFLNCDDFTPGTQVCSTETSFAIPPDSYETRGSSFTGGTQFGFNFRTGLLVAGLEGDFNWTGIDERGSYDQVFNFTCCVIVRASDVQQQLDWLSTIRGRVGIVAGDALIYATGGLAAGHVSYRFTLDWPDIGGFASDNASKTEFGWTGGGGVEYSFGTWSIKTEYLYYDLGGETLNAPFKLTGVAQPFVFKPEFETRGHLVRAGLNFQLN
jgi:opacity protein-like surface antigen